MKIFVIFLLLLSATSSYSFECKVCHSKNPKMVSMHKALNFKDCFNCHRPGGIKKDNLKEQAKSDEKCIRCHNR
ncbi:MAG: cytochrome C [Proteobacteria bacterium]|nr:cytochrome C [Pseudomonadota bacterium]